ncbi:histidine phosphatase family protein [Psychrobacillus lasiicapitis]|uniref:Histidine phosphatase family protein n=1 Tax=Psychrobacillus lasiicapitis TaxID=1636719 RepID=A0A544TH35_9BACI|nr:histidine phosphatase family protein [Psychrobacillus lasiicapitis]TQR16775.1 histidine phosphatase family protein [Psychrobacillus lasiicapitis]GGA27319.1 phosphoglycerate mutase [Psychrobacillus lasiicapitis]
MKINLYFVRHAHSTYSSDELNRPLSERGMEDAKLATNLLKELPIDHVISSPYKRAIQTVEGIAEYIGKEIELNDGFRERLLSEHPVADFDKAISQVWKDFDFALEGGESNYVAQKRGVEATFQVLDRFEGQNIVIGTHGNIQVLIMNYFDQQYDVRFWEQLAMPDIYKLTFNKECLEQVSRMNTDERSLSITGYTI